MAIKVEKLRDMVIFAGKFPVDTKCHLICMLLFNVTVYGKCV